VASPDNVNPQRTRSISIIYDARQKALHFCVAHFPS
jgi:hypothetical protein